jgi:methionine-rich copper-binding protein CopC
MTFSSIRAAGSAVALLALAAGSVPQAANAHALLQSAEPSVGGSVAGSPSTIVLQFSEGVEARYSHVSVTGPGGGRSVQAIQWRGEIDPGRQSGPTDQTGALPGQLVGGVR